ncbi:MAG: glycosyltransferase family 2 protein [Patescibacteria group bacterium]|jgi:glycosyltransferase
MKISIITPTYNSAKTLQDTLESISQQSHQNLEHLIINGLSKDDTLKIAREYQEKFPYIKIISEKDSGIYEAMNKGISLASGDIITILNSDDFYIDNEVLAKVSRIFEEREEIQAVYGDLIYVKRKDVNKNIRHWISGEYQEEKLNWGWTIPHPTFFLRSEIYKKNKYNTSLALASDYELILRLLKIDKIKTYYLPQVLVKMRAGGSSGKDIFNRIRGWRELKESWKINSLVIPRFFILRRLFCKVNQFFKTIKIY